MKYAWQWGRIGMGKAGSFFLACGFALILVLALSGTAWAATWHVRADADPGGDGTSWETAFDTVNEAVIAANFNPDSDGDEVWIGKGTYYPSSTIEIYVSINLYGGFDGNETELSQRNWSAHETILDGGGVRRILYVGVNNCIVDGITFTHGSADDGGAIVIGSSTLRNCKILDSVATSTDTSGYYGGGGISAAGTTSFINCVIAGNSAGYGGGVLIRNGSAVFTNCTLTQNTGFGGGVYVYTDSGPGNVFYNCIFWGNSSDYGSADPFNYPATGSNNCAALYAFGPNQISTNPLLMDPAGGDFRIGPGSSCIDKGTDAVTLPPTDFEGDDRRLDGDGNGTLTVDIGADEFDPDAHIVADFYVDGVNGDDADDGTTWARAKATLQAAINAAAANNEIWIRGGTYSLTSGIVVDKAVRIYGGFAGTENTRNSRDPETYPTIIDGHGTVRCLQITGVATVDGISVMNGSADNGGGVLMSAAGAILSHCIISGNVTTGLGGGIYCSRDAIIDHCTITNNAATGDGGGIYNGFTSPVISNCTIADNTAGNGGGIFNDGGFAPQISDCLIRGNYASNRGGGICNDEKNNAVITRCTILSNTASARGGGIYSGQDSSSNTDDAAPVITNCVVANNWATWGGGLYCAERSTSRIVNCTLAGNTAATAGAGVYVYYRYSYTSIMNSIFYGNVLDAGGHADIFFEYFDGITGSSVNNLRLLYNDFSALVESWHNAGAPYKVGNMALPAGFADYEGPDGDPLTGGDGDYHLTQTSQILDKGIPGDGTTFGMVAPADDLEKNSRPQGLGIDLGAYELTNATPVYTLAASVVGGNGTVSPESGNYYKGTLVNLVATADAGYQVASWTGTDDDGSVNSFNTVTMNGNCSVSVRFEAIPVTVYSLTVDVQGQGSVDPSSGPYDAGTAITLTATPDEGWMFDGWIGGTGSASLCSGTDPCEFLISGDCTVTAVFSLKSYTVSLSANPAEGGSVSGGGAYDLGATVTATASANPDYVFVNWTEGSRFVSAQQQYSFKVESSRSLAANFSPVESEYAVSGTVSPEFGGSLSGAGSYDPGETAILTVQTYPGFAFVNWTESWPGVEGECIVSTAEQYVFTVDRNRNLKATVRPLTMPGLILLLEE